MFLFVEDIYVKFSYFIYLLGGDLFMSLSAINVLKPVTKVVDVTFLDTDCNSSELAFGKAGSVHPTSSVENSRNSSIRL